METVRTIDIHVLSLLSAFADAVWGKCHGSDGVRRIIVGYDAFEALGGRSDERSFVFAVKSGPITIERAR